MTTTRPTAVKLARLLRERPSDFTVGKADDYYYSTLIDRLHPEYVTFTVGGPAPFSVTFNDAEFVLEVGHWLEIVNHHSYGYTPRTDTPWEDITPTLATILPDPL